MRVFPGEEIIVGSQYFGVFKYTKINKNPITVFRDPFKIVVNPHTERIIDPKFPYTCPNSAMIQHMFYLRSVRAKIKEAKDCTPYFMVVSSTAKFGVCGIERIPFSILDPPRKKNTPGTFC